MREEEGEEERRSLVNWRDSLGLILVSRLLNLCEDETESLAWWDLALVGLFLGESCGGSGVVTDEARSNRENAGGDGGRSSSTEVDIFYHSIDTISFGGWLFEPSFVC